MKKVVGYLFAVAGLGLMAFGLGTNTIASYAGIVLVVIGVILVIVAGRGDSEEKQLQKEVPIYKGKEIIGYRRK